MPGLIPHLIAALFAAIVVHLIHFRIDYSFSIFFGNLLPDIIKFGFSAIEQGTIKIFSVKPDKFYLSLNTLTHTNFENWLVLGFFVFAVAMFLFHFHYIREKTMEEYDGVYIFLLIGIFMHLIMDALILEHGPWI